MLIEGNKVTLNYAEMNSTGLPNTISLPHEYMDICDQVDRDRNEIQRRLAERDGYDQFDDHKNIQRLCLIARIGKEVIAQDTRVIGDEFARRFDMLLAEKTNQ